MIEFKFIEIKGYKSIKHLVFDLSTTGTTIIKGKNGAGKTTVFDALYWALYGKSLKGTTKSSIAPLYNDIDTEVTVELNDFTVTRTLNELVIEDDKGVLNLLNINAAEDYIQQALGVSAKMFLSAILFGQNLMRFLKTSDSEKKATLEELFDQLSFVDDLKKKIIDEVKIKEADIYEDRVHIGRVEGVLEGKQAELARLDEAKKTFEKSRQVKLASLKQQLKDEIGNLAKTLTLDTALRDEVADMAEVIADFEKTIDIEDECSTCGRPYKNAKALKAMQKKAQAELDILLPGFKKKADKWNKLKKEYDAEVANKTYTEKTIAAIEVKIKELEEEAFPISQKKLEREIEKKETQLKDLNDAVQVKEEDLNNHKWWVKNGFSTKGLKSYLLNDLLTSLTDRLYAYSSLTGVQVTMRYDPNKARKAFQIICIIDNHIINYSDLSGGEKVRVDLCVSFALNDMICDNIDTNLLVLDEAFENLDEDGLFAAQELIRMKEGKSVFVITHRTDIDVVGANIIEFSKKDGNTVIL